MNREYMIRIDECHKCHHFEKEKKRETGEKVVMCKFCIDENVEPLEIQWVLITQKEVECIMKKYQSMKQTK